MWAEIDNLLDYFPDSHIRTDNDNETDMAKYASPTYASITTPIFGAASSSTSMGMDISKIPVSLLNTRSLSNRKSISDDIGGIIPPKDVFLRVLDSFVCLLEKTPEYLVDKLNVHV
jgi:hypothetical protein